MASDLLLSKVPIPAENIHRMRGEAANPELAAREYETFLERFFDLVAGDVPRFDLILLGMGADGHTASLFPGTAALNERQRLVVANFVPTLGATRLTLTVPILNNARQVLFLVAGKSKAGALSAVLADKVEQQELPASVVRPEKGEVHWLVDEAAASKLCLGSGSGGLGVRIP
jgi:6-phosphogluconolactonase